MCANIGVDPLSSNKGTWNKLLGFGGGQGPCPCPATPLRRWPLGVQAGAGRSACQAGPSPPVGPPGSMFQAVAL